MGVRFGPFIKGKNIQFKSSGMFSIYPKKIPQNCPEFEKCESDSFLDTTPSLDSHHRLKYFGTFLCNYSVYIAFLSSLLNDKQLCKLNFGLTGFLSYDRFLFSVVAAPSTFGVKNEHPHL